MEIIPAILAHNEKELCEKLADLPRGAQSAHVDLTENPPSYPFSFVKEGARERILEAHLMLPYPQEYIAELVKAGFGRMAIQVEKLTSETFSALIHEWKHAVEILPSLEIETPLSMIDSYAHELGGVQLMGIAKIGAQGRPFDARVVERVATLHVQYPRLTISVDGGVSKENIGTLEAAGAARVVVGSHLKDFYG